jgi:hypothetical protein
MKKLRMNCLLLPHMALLLSYHGWGVKVPNPNTEDKQRAAKANEIVVAVALQPLLHGHPHGPCAVRRVRRLSLSRCGRALTVTACVPIESTHVAAMCSPHASNDRSPVSCQWQSARTFCSPEIDAPTFTLIFNGV